MAHMKLFAGTLSSNTEPFREEAVVSQCSGLFILNATVIYLVATVVGALKSVKF